MQNNLHGSTSRGMAFSTGHLLTDHGYDPAPTCQMVLQDALPVYLQLTTLVLDCRSPTVRALFI